jgi:transcriptional regulator with XRE-family HTH domain
MRIKAFRKLRGYTQQQFSNECGLSLTIIGAIERGMRHLDRRTLDRMVGVLGVSEEELYGDQFIQKTSAPLSQGQA